MMTMAIQVKHIYLKLINYVYVVFIKENESV